jgi:hypothetical protein
MNRYRVGSLTTVAREIADFQVDLMGAKEAGWDRMALNQQVITNSSV